uniref:CSD domain-containing protein n=1 Tax=Engystomops pustulosus TaxID=76066 RepID=A0AAV6YK23_ENGPU|nr:hypothetical protein GDO81_024336 [Engystomops pustulosus]
MLPRAVERRSSTPEVNPCKNCTSSATSGAAAPKDFYLRNCGAATNSSPPKPSLAGNPDDAQSSTHARMARTPPPVAQEKLEPATALGGKDSDSTPWPEADFLPCLREAPVLKWMLSGEDCIMWGPPPFPPVERPDFYEVFETMVVVSAQPVRRPSAGHRLHRGITRAFVTRTCYQTVTHYPIPPGRILVPIPAAIPVARAHVEAPRGEAPTPAEPTPGPSTTAPPAPRSTPPATRPASPARVVPDPPVVPAPVPAPTCRPRRSEPAPEPRAPAPAPPQPRGRGEAARRRLRDAVSDQRRREKEAQRYMAGRSTAGAWVEKNRTTGMVRFFDKRKGYGFATQDYTGREVFIPRRSVKRPDLPESQHNLKPGECIEFSLQEGPRGPWAAGVIRIPDSDEDRYYPQDDWYEDDEWPESPNTSSSSAASPRAVTHVNAPSTVIVSTGPIAIHGPGMIQGATPNGSPAGSIARSRGSSVGEDIPAGEPCPEASTRPSSPIVTYQWGDDPAPEEPEPEGAAALPQVPIYFFLDPSVVPGSVEPPAGTADTPGDSAPPPEGPEDVAAPAVSTAATGCPQPAPTPAEEAQDSLLTLDPVPVEPSEDAE